MHIHEAARAIIDSPELPRIMTADHKSGLCSALRRVGAVNAYVEMLNHMRGCGVGSSYLAEPGVWTEQRLNFLCLLACTDPEEFANPDDLYLSHEH